jgi:hypothetical protein
MVPEDSPLQRIRRLATDSWSPAHSLGSPPPHHWPAFPASFSQLRFWRLDQYSDGTACAIPDVLHLHGELQLKALISALDHLVERHESLRTTYQPGGEDLLQVVGPAQGLELQVESLPQNQGLEAVTERLQQELDRPFDTVHGPLMRGVLFHGRPGEHLLLLIFHYSAFDGWSRTVLYRELPILYEAAVEGATSPLPKLPLRYIDFASWQRRSLAPADRDRLLRYWSEALNNLPRVILPADHPASPRPTYRGLSAYFELDQSLVAGLENLCRSASVTLSMGLLALVASLLHLHSGQDDIGIGIPVAGRRHPSLEPLIGSFINLLVIRIRLSDAPSFRRLLGRVRIACLQAYDHQNLPFVMLEEALWSMQPPHAYVPVVVQLMDLPWRPSFRGLVVRRLPSPSRRTRHELEFRFRHLPGGSLQTKIIYSTDRFSATTIRALFEGMKLLLVGLLHGPDCALENHSTAD